MRHTHVAAAAAADSSQQTAQQRSCADVAVSSLLLLLREGQTAQEAVLTWQFFFSPPFSGLLGLRGTATMVLVLMARQLARVLFVTAAGVGLGLVGGEFRGLPVWQVG